MEKDVKRECISSNRWFANLKTKGYSWRIAVWKTILTFQFHPISLVTLRHPLFFAHLFVLPRRTNPRNSKEEEPKGSSHSFGTFTTASVLWGNFPFWNLSWSCNLSTNYHSDCRRRSGGPGYDPQNLHEGGRAVSDLVKIVFHSASPPRNGGGLHHQQASG